MNPLQEIHLALATDYFQFYILDEQATGNLGGDWTDETVDMLLTTTTGIIWVGTLRNTEASVSVKLFAAEPLLDARDDIRQVNAGITR